MVEGKQRYIFDIAKRISSDFSIKKEVLTFEEYLGLVEREPWLHIRSAAQYLKDCFNYYGSYTVQGIGGPIKRFRIFDLGETKVHGQEEAQNRFYSHLSAFAEKGKADRILILNGPNGTGKTSFVEAIMLALEDYSKTPEGAIYTFDWVFSDYDGKEGLGFGSKKIDVKNNESLAHIPAEDITFKIRSNLKDSPLFLIPKQQRQNLLSAFFSKYNRIPNLNSPILTGDMSHKHKEIYNEMLLSNQGDWLKVVRHIQVKRLYVSKRYRKCAVTIEPQKNVDAQSKALTLEKDYDLPRELKQTDIYEVYGDLVDGNRGIVEYSDLFKRHMEVNKYLLTTSEKGTINLTSTTAFLDLVMTATSNEKQLSLFQNDPDWSSFKARMEFIRMPYLRQVSKEEEIYSSKINVLSRGKHISRHTSKAISLWAVITRLRKPNPENYNKRLSSLVSRLSVIEKAHLQDTGHAPKLWNDNDRKELLAGLKKIAEEFDDQVSKFEGIVGPEYEGRRGVSAREVITIINDAALTKTFDCLSPLAIFESIENFIKNEKLHDFLRLPEGIVYGTPAKLLEEVKDEFRRWIVKDITDSTGLVTEEACIKLFRDYFMNVRAYVKKEKILNPKTGKREDPDEYLMTNVENIIGISNKDKKKFHTELIQRIASWSMENRDKKIEFKNIFSDIFQTIKTHHYKQQRKNIDIIMNNILKYETDDWKLLSLAEQREAENTMFNLMSIEYCPKCIKENVKYILRTQK